MTTPAPPHLSTVAAAIWDDLVASLGQSAERLAGPDLEAYVVQIARMRDAQARIDAEGLVVADEKGRPIPHPALAIEKAAQTEVRAWAVKFRRR